MKVPTINTAPPPVPVEQPKEPPPDCATWIVSSVTITEPNAKGDDESIIPFVLWDAQRSTLDAILHNAQVIILKARQLGITWLVIAYCVWLCIFHANKVVLFISRDLDSAKQMIKRARGIYGRLVKRPTILVVDNTQELTWANNSTMKSLAATEDAGSSYTASVIVLDEYAKMRYADGVRTATKPAIDAGGQMIVLSSAKGKSGPFAELWRKAKAGLSGFVAVFIPWHARPGRDASWYANVARDAVSMAAHQQEYPATEEEAFQDLSPERFIQDMAWWRACRNDQLPPIDKHTPIVIALDAGVTNDSFALVATGLHPTIEQGVAVHFVQEWKPEGGKIDYDAPMQVVRELIDKYDVQMVTGDPYQLHYFFGMIRKELDVAVSEFPQGGARLEADMQLKSLITQRRLEYAGAQPELTAHIDNADAKVSEDKKLRIVKRHQEGKIDLTVALSMSAYKALKVLSF